MNKVGIIGTGAIGLPIAQRMIDGNLNLLFYARNSKVINLLVDCGGKFIDSVEELGEACDKVFLFVKNFDDCMDCIKKLLVKMRDGIIVIGATISPEEIMVLENKCKGNNVSLISAPVTGGVRGAVSGTLTTMVSGNINTVETLKPVFNTYCSKIVYMGNELKSAFVMKSLVQFLVGINTVALAETFVLGEGNGLSREQIYDVICSSAGASKIFENRGRRIIQGDYAKQGTIEILNKDLNIVHEIAKNTGVPVFLESVVVKLFNVANVKLNNQEDFNAIIKLYDKFN